MAALHARSITPSWPEADMQHHCAQDMCLGAGKPLEGFIIVKRAADQAEILTLVTDPEHRQKGTGRALLTHMEHLLIAQKTQIIFLEVAEDNHPAIALYKSCFYEAFGRRPAYYKRESGRVAAISFRKRLDA